MAEHELATISSGCAVILPQSASHKGSFQLPTTRLLVQDRSLWQMLGIQCIGKGSPS
jgi:hypothetical protein